MRQDKPKVTLMQDYNIQWFESTKNSITDVLADETQVPPLALIPQFENQHFINIYPFLDNSSSKTTV